jgi:signal transduction histidine kinase
VWVRVARDGASALLVVEDDGPGIPPEERERVFERFHRSRRDVPGVGLGLAIVKAIVREHRGEITLSERPGGGARFEVRVPVAS